jgi:hypothetical protein
MSQLPDDIDWSLTTWEGSRRAQLSRALTLTLRDRLLVLDGMAEIAERLRRMRETGKLSTRVVALKEGVHFILQPLNVHQRAPFDARPTPRLSRWLVGRHCCALLRLLAN